jgi:hypothetical protein
MAGFSIDKTARLRMTNGVIEVRNGALHLPQGSVGNPQVSQLI